MFCRRVNKTISEIEGGFVSPFPIAAKRIDRKIRNGLIERYKLSVEAGYEIIQVLG